MYTERATSGVFLFRHILINLLRELMRQAVALPLSYFLKMRKVGFEPTTYGLETKEVLVQEVECQIGFEPTKCNFADCTPNHLATGTGADIRT